jgi:hypothetical protein
MSTENRKKIADLITKLLAKANDAATTDAEADAFLAKVDELMQLHQISLHELGGENDPMGREMDEEFKVYVSMPWVKQLIPATCRYYGGEVIWAGKQGSVIRFWVAGRESVRATVFAMLPYLVSQVRRQARDMSKDTGETKSKCERSIGVMLANRLIRLRREREENQTVEQTRTRNALIPVAELTSFLESLDLEYKKSRTTSVDARGSGYAGKISLAEQVRGGKGGTAMIGQG